MSCNWPQSKLALASRYSCTRSVGINTGVEGQLGTLTDYTSVNPANNRRSRGLEPERCGTPFLFDRVKKLASHRAAAEGRPQSGQCRLCWAPSAPHSRDLPDAATRAEYASYQDRRCPR